MDLTPKQQTSEAIRQAETILITTGQHPSVDQVAAVIGLAMILRKFGKKVTAVVSDALPQSVQMLDTASVERNMNGIRDFVLKLDVSKAELDKLRYEVIDGKLQIFVTPFKGNFAPSDVTFDYGPSNYQYDLAVVLGVPTRARIDRIYDQNQVLFASIPVVNLDFHRSNESYGAVNLIEPNASSLCEMLVALSESLQSGIIDAEIATTLLMGIVASTDRFTASHTTSKSLTVAAQMMAAGARQQAVVKALYRDGRENRGEREQPRSDQPRTEQPRTEQRQPAPRVEREQQPVRREAPVSSAPAGPSVAPVAATPAPVETESAMQVATTEPVASVAAAVPGPVTSEMPAEPVAVPAPIVPVAQADLGEMVQEPMQDVRPFRAGEDLPIIDPSHIELSEPEVPAETLERAPMADFAAAAEILAEHRSEE